MQEFENGEEVLWDNQSGEDSYIFIGLGGKGMEGENLAVLEHEKTGLTYAKLEYVKPKPATIKVNGFEVDAPLNNDNIQELTNRGCPLTLIFRDEQSAKRFMLAKDGIDPKGGGSDG